MVCKTHMRDLLFVLLSIFAITLTTSVNVQPKRTIPTFSATETDELYKEIQSYANEHNVKPIDAKIDRVWKAIPGYNGWEVDVDASYQNMLPGAAFEPSKIVFKETAPNIHLDDLDPSPIFRGNPEKPMNALLINVAWGNEFIPQILEILKDNEVKATFFFDGSWVKANPDLATMIHAEGHEIGNHAYSHPDLQQRSRSETMEELRKTNEVINSTLAVQPIWFAPPSGSFNNTTVAVADELGMKTILWTVDTVDWKQPKTSDMVTRVVAEASNGSMILMHPTKPVAEGLGSMIRGIKEKGLKLGTVSELMNEERINSDR